MVQVWRYIFGGDVPDVPKQIGQACCSQFAVSNEQIWKRPRQDYIRMQRFLLETELTDDISGRIFEYFWHIIFGKEAVVVSIEDCLIQHTLLTVLSCPSEDQCYCDVYGKCRQAGALNHDTYLNIGEICL